MDLKARIYDSQNEEMLAVRSLYIDMDIAYVGNLDNLKRIHLTNTSVMLWTGHKDVNGKDIYERDYITSSAHKTPILIQDILHFGYMYHLGELENMYLVGHEFNKP